MENHSKRTALLLQNSKIKEIERGDLYSLLSVCTNVDLDPLVKIITDRIINFLEINEDFKLYNPDHTKYYRIIGDEIRLFGGNSFKNLFRGNEGPNYDEIVTDVCKKLDIPYKLGETLKNESNVLSIYLDRQWKSLSREEQDEIIANARAESKKSLNNLSNLIKGGGSLLLSRAVLGPVGWGTIVFSFADPAFKVTVPCVLHIAYLRKKFLDEIQSSCNSPYVSDSDSKSSLAPCYHRYTTPIEFGLTENEIALSLTQISDVKIQEWFPVSEIDERISKLNPLLQAVPSIATAGEVATTKYMEVIINGPLLKAKGKEGYRLITMIDKKPSHGTLLDPKKLSNIVNASALLQIASIAVAQKHLADINEKLSEIKACVARILQHLEGERLSILTGSIQYFKQIAQSVLTGELSDAVRNQIERHEADLLRVQNHILGEIRQESKEIIKIKDNDMFGSEGMQKAIEKHQIHINNLYQQLILCIRARTCGWQLFVAFPGEELLKTDRKHSIQSSLDTLTESGELLKETDLHMRKKIKELSSVWNKKKTVNDRKLSLLGWNDTLLAEVTSCKEQIEQNINAIESVISNQRQPTTMIVKVEAGKVVSYCPVIN
jgi:uncharacterized protein YaaW (UPF0174 family)